jgi:hypothetical protein
VRFAIKSVSSSELGPSVKLSLTLSVAETVEGHCVDPVAQVCFGSKITVTIQPGPKARSKGSPFVGAPPGPQVSVTKKLDGLPAGVLARTTVKLFSVAPEVFVNVIGNVADVLSACPGKVREDGLSATACGQVSKLPNRGLSTAKQISPKSPVATAPLT